MYDDTIAAISTAVGDAGIGIVRVSGQDAVPILRRIFRPATTSGNIGKGLVPFRSDDSDRASWRASLPASRTVEGDRASACGYGRWPWRGVVPRVPPRLLRAHRGPGHWPGDRRGHRPLHARAPQL